MTKCTHPGCKNHYSHPCEKCRKPKFPSLRVSISTLVNYSQSAEDTRVLMRLSKNLYNPLPKHQDSEIWN
jgi:hypothetical protein